MTSADVTVAFGKVSFATFSQLAASAMAVSLFCASAVCDRALVSKPSTRILSTDAPQSSGTCEGEHILAESLRQNKAAPGEEPARPTATSPWEGKIVLRQTSGNEARVVHARIQRHARSRCLRHPPQTPHPLMARRHHALADEIHDQRAYLGRGIHRTRVRKRPQQRIGFRAVV